LRLSGIGFSEEYESVMLANQLQKAANVAPNAQD